MNEPTTESGAVRKTAPTSATQATSATAATTATATATTTATATDRDILVALAGNPNTGKSTVFNALTGLRQHTGNWPGKTVTRAEGTYTHAGRRHHVVDLPGTYSLLAMSPDEEVAREFLLFGEPDVTVVVVDSGRLERNLNLVFQVTAITDRVVVCLNLVDESARHGVYVNARELSRALGVPVVATSAASKEGLPELADTITAVAEGRLVPSPTRLHVLPEPIAHAGRHRFALTEEAHQRLTEAIYVEAARIAEHVVSRAPNAGATRRDLRVDRLLTSRITGFPIMLLLFTAVFWITITGANVPSQWLSWLLLDRGHTWLTHLALAVHAPAWLHGLLIDGVYLATAWVVSVMLPPMAIFFPLFTLLEDSGYLPRVAFNLDAGFRRCGAHGKQALCMMMGYGCNAAGIVSARIIDSPRERLIAMITNNFAVCNGRWPTLILVASLFVATQVPAPLAALTAALTVVGVALFGVLLALACSWGLSRTVLRGHVSTFSLELPPYRRPKLLMTLYTSWIDRTLFVLWRAVMFAAPAGAVIWLVANVRAGDTTIAEHLIRTLDPFGVAIGLNGIILLAYVIAIPANEIVLPTVLMLTVLVTGTSGVGEGAGVLFQLDSRGDTLRLLEAGGWTLLTGVNLMLFSLAHNPCSTTLYTMYRETKSARWTTLATLLPLALGILLTFVVARVWRLVVAGG